MSNVWSIRSFLNTDTPLLAHIWSDHHSAYGSPSRCNASLWDQCILSKAYFSPNQLPGSYGPVVFRVEFGETSTGVDHRFDGKAHARQESVLLAFSIWEVGDVWVLMEAAAESMSDVFANDRKTPLGRFGDDIVTDNADGASRF